MFFKLLFGTPKPTSFELDRLPPPNQKFTSAMAKKYLKEFLNECKFGDKDDIADEVRLFGEFISDQKHFLKDELDSLKDDLASEKECLRDAKQEVSSFKKEKKAFLAEYDPEDYEIELAELTDAVNEQHGYIEDQNDLINIQKIINSSSSTLPRRALPVYANKLLQKTGGRPLDLEVPQFLKPVRVHLTYQSTKQVATNDHSQRIVDIEFFSNDRFSGYCHMRQEKRTFTYKGTKCFGPDFNSTNEIPLLQFLLNHLTKV